MSGAGAVIRTIYYRALLASGYSNVDFVYSMGGIGEAYYLRCGVQSSCLFPFCYTVDSMRIGAKHTDHTSAENMIRILYIGQFYEWKAVDILLRALYTNSGLNWKQDLTAWSSDESNAASVCFTEDGGKSTFSRSHGPYIGDGEPK